MRLGIKLIGDGGSMRSYVRTQSEMTKSPELEGLLYSQEPCLLISDCVLT